MQFVLYLLLILVLSVDSVIVQQDSQVHAVVAGGGGLNGRVVRCAYGGFFNGTSLHRDGEDIVGIRMHCSRGSLLIEGVGRVSDTYVFGSTSATSQIEVYGCNFKEFLEQPQIKDQEGLYYVNNNQKSIYPNNVSFSYQDAINGLLHVQTDETQSYFKEILFGCFPYAPNRKDLSKKQTDLYVLRNHSTELNGKNIWGCDMSSEFFKSRQAPYTEVVYRVMAALEITFEEGGKLYGIRQRACRDIWPRDPQCVEGCGPHDRISRTNNEPAWEGTDRDPNHVDAAPVYCRDQLNQGWYDAKCQGYNHEYCKYVFVWHEEVMLTWKSCASSQPRSTCIKRRNLQTDEAVFQTNYSDYMYYIVDPLNNCQHDDHISYGWFLLQNSDNETQCIGVQKDLRELEWQECPLNQSAVLISDLDLDFRFWFRDTKDGKFFESGILPGMCVTNQIELKACVENFDEFISVDVTKVTISTTNWTEDSMVFEKFLDAYKGFLEDYTPGKYSLYPHLGWNRSQVVQTNNKVRSSQLYPWELHPTDLMLSSPPWKTWGEVWVDHNNRIIQLRPTFFTQVEDLKIELSVQMFALKRLRGFNGIKSGLSGTLPELNEVKPSGSLRSFVVLSNRFVGSMPYDWPFSPGLRNLIVVGIGNQALEEPVNRLSGPVPVHWTLDSAFGHVPDTPFNKTKINIQFTPTLCQRQDVSIPPQFKKPNLETCRDMVPEQGADLVLTVEVEATISDECIPRQNLTAEVRELMKDTISHKVLLLDRRGHYNCSDGLTTLSLYGKGLYGDFNIIKSLFNSRVNHIRHLNQSSYLNTHYAILQVNYAEGSSGFNIQNTSSDVDPDYYPTTHQDNDNTVVIVVVVVICGVVLIAFFAFLFVAYKNQNWPWKQRYLRKENVSYAYGKNGAGVSGGYPEAETLTEFIHVDYQSKATSALSSGLFNSKDSSLLSVVQNSQQVSSSSYLPVLEIKRSPSNIAETYEDFETDINVNLERDLKFELLLGSGGFGVVYKAQWSTRSGDLKPVAIKLINSHAVQQQLDTQQRRKIQDIFYEEINVMLKIKHPQIVRFYGACLRPESLSLLMEYMDGGSLEQVLYDEEHGRQLSYFEMLSVLECIASALVYLHPKIIHKDIKPQNILISSKGNVKIADFGLSQIKAMDKSLSYHQAIGTPAYLPPEAWTQSSCTSKGDVFQFGMLAWEMFTMKKPWRQFQNIGQIVNKVAIEKGRPEIPQECPEFLKELINDCWKQEPTERPTATDIWNRVKKELLNLVLTQNVPLNQT